MSLGWFTLGASGDVQITSLNVGEGILFTERETRRVGINIDNPPSPLIASLQIGVPIGTFPQKVIDEGAMSMLVVAEKGYRPTSFNQPGAGSFGFSNTLDSTLWLNTNDTVPVGQGTGIALGGRTSHGHFPFVRMTGIRDDDVLDRGGFTLEVLNTLPNNPAEFGDFAGQPVLFERMRITGDGKIGFGGVSDPEFGVEIQDDLGCRGIFNGGYERFEPTSYNVSGSTVTDLNSINIYGNTSQQTDTWYYSLENRNKARSRGNCLTFDSLGSVYTGSVIGVGPGTVPAGAFREGETLRHPTVNNGLSFPRDLGLVTKNDVTGELIWAIRFSTYVDINNVLSPASLSVTGISVARNSNSVSGAERFDVYVMGVTTGNVINVHTSTPNEWIWDTQIVYPSTNITQPGTQNGFVARFEPIFDGRNEVGAVIKEFVAIEGPFLFPMGIDVTYPQSFIPSSLFSDTKIAFGVINFKNASIPAINRNVSLRYFGGTFKNVGSTNPLTLNISTITPLITHDIPAGQYILSVFRLGGTVGKYLDGSGTDNKRSFFINTNIPSIGDFFSPSDYASDGTFANNFIVSREGTIRMGRDISKNAVFVAIPVSNGSISYNTPGAASKEIFTSTTMPRSGSLTIMVQNNLLESDIVYVLNMMRGGDAGTSLLTRSIDIDSGPNGNGLNSSAYIAGAFSGGFSVRRFTRATTGTFVSLTEELTFSPPQSNTDKSAFVMKVSDEGVVRWMAVVDGDNVDEGISVAVEDDVLQDKSGKYNVYLSGVFKGDGITLYEANVYDSANDPTNRLRVRSDPNMVIAQSELGKNVVDDTLTEDGINVVDDTPTGHIESFVIKFSYDGSALFNYKTTGTENVHITYLDVGPNGNVAVCGMMNTPLFRVQEPDGAISRYIPKDDGFWRGFLLKFRTTNTLILLTPNGVNEDRIFRKTIINTAGFPLYIAIVDAVPTANSVPNVAVIPGRKSMDFIYDVETWVPESSDKLTTDLLFLDRDNGRFGFGTTQPRATMDVRGDLSVAGFVQIGRDLEVNGDVKILGNISCGEDGINSTINVTNADDTCPYKVNGVSILPPGMIVMWSGEVDELPPGWALCDGQGGRPDLRGRFVLGYSGLEGPSKNGINVLTNPSGTSATNIFNPSGGDYDPGFLSVGDVSGESGHTLTFNELPQHRHIIPWRNSQPDGGTVSANNNFNFSGPPNMPTPQQVDNGDADATSFTGDGGSHNNMPPYYVLAFIIKI